MQPGALTSWKLCGKNNSNEKKKPLHQSRSWVFKAALSRTFDILVALAALVLLYWPVLGGVTGGVWGARCLFWDLWRWRHGKLSAVCRSRESSWISVQFTTKTRRKCWMAPSTPAWKTHIRAGSSWKEMKKKACVHVRTHMHTVLTLPFTGLFIMARGKV